MPTELHAADLAPGIRAELLLGCLAATTTASSEIRAQLTRTVVELHCADAGAETGELWLESPTEATALAWYECGADYGVRHVVLAKEVSPQKAHQPVS